MAMRLLDRSEVERFRAGIDCDPEFKLAARYMTLNLVIEFGDQHRLFKVREGKLEEIGPVIPMGDSVDVYIRGTKDFWEKLLQPVPPTGFQNVQAGARSGDTAVAGSYELFSAYIWAINRMIDVMRELQNS